MGAVWVGCERSAGSSCRAGEEPVLFDDAEDILLAEYLGLVEVTQPGVVVLCSIICEEGAEARKHRLPEDEFRYAFDVNAGF
jgi:hypothetical protein